MTEKNNIPEIIGELKKLSNTEIKKRIDNYLVWQNFGIDFIKQLGINAFLDNLTNPDKKLNVISNYCDKVLAKQKRNFDIDKLIKWVLLFGAIPIIYYALEIIKIVYNYFHCCHCK